MINMQTFLYVIIQTGFISLPANASYHPAFESACRAQPGYRLVGGSCFVPPGGTDEMVAMEQPIILTTCENNYNMTALGKGRLPIVARPAQIEAVKTMQYTTITDVNLQRGLRLALERTTVVSGDPWSNLNWRDTLTNKLHPIAPSGSGGFGWRAPNPDNNVDLENCIAYIVDNNIDDSYNALADWRCEWQNPLCEFVDRSHSTHFAAVADGITADSYYVDVAESEVVEHAITCGYLCSYLPLCQAITFDTVSGMCQVLYTHYENHLATKPFVTNSNAKWFNRIDD